MPAIRKKLWKARKINAETTALLNEAMREKLHKAKTDKRAVALEIIQVLLAMMVALAGIFFLLPDKPLIRKLLSLYYPQALVEEYLAQIPQPPWSYALFAVVLIAAVWLYSFTKWYRRERRQSKRILGVEIALLLLIFISAYLYFEPGINVIPPPFSYAIFGALILALIALLVYMRFFKG